MRMNEDGSGIQPTSTGPVLLWARGMACSTADRTCFFQLLGSGIVAVWRLLDIVPPRSRRDYDKHHGIVSPSEVFEYADCLRFYKTITPTIYTN